MDRYIPDFAKRNPKGIIVELMCGLETAYYRCKTKENIWYEVDYEYAIKYCKEILGKVENNFMIALDVLSDTWIKEIRAAHKDTPVILISSGLFYFKKDDILNLIKMLKNYGNIEIIFDIVNHFCMKQIGVNI